MPAGTTYADVQEYIQKPEDTMPYSKLPQGAAKEEIMRCNRFSATTVRKRIASPRWSSRGLVAAAVGLLAAAATLAADGPATKPKLWVGAATADITPKPPVALTGFQSVRLTRTIQSPLMASVLALEARDGSRVLDQAILISCDLCVIRPGIQEGFRKYLAPRLPGFDVRKLFMAATHTHSAPEVRQDEYDEKDYGEAMQPKDYVPLLYERVAEAVVKAWESRAVGAFGRGLGHAVVGHNRRVVFMELHVPRL
jgi:hypothetical protein